MHNGFMHDGWGGGSWGWLMMAALMVIFWAGIIWVGVALIRHISHPASAHGGTTASPLPPAVRPDPQDVLAERLARGDIEPDDYRKRLETLRQGRAE
jgi:putative membrane protein